MQMVESLGLYRGFSAFHQKARLLFLCRILLAIDHLIADAIARHAARATFPAYPGASTWSEGMASRSCWRVQAALGWAVTLR